MDVQVLWLLGIVCFLLCLEGNMAQSTSSPSECVCSCVKNEIPTDEEERQKLGEQEAEKIKEELEVDKTALSSSVRKKSSAKDDRPSAQNVGYLGVAMLSLAMGIILFMDAPYVIQFGHSLYMKVKMYMVRDKIN